MKAKVWTKLNGKWYAPNEDIPSKNNQEYVNAEDYTVKELKDKCKELGLSGYSRKNQDELIEMINNELDKRAGE
jgi:hypothetical protein